MMQYVNCICVSVNGESTPSYIHGEWWTKIIPICSYLCQYHGKKVKSKSYEKTIP